VSKAAIISISDASVWGTSKGFLQPTDPSGIVALMKNPSDVFSKGISVAGVRYMGIKGHGTTVEGKKVYEPCEKSIVIDKEC
jgi:hypothetical protein